MWSDTMVSCMPRLSAVESASSSVTEVTVTLALAPGAALDRSQNTEPGWCRKGNLSWPPPVFTMSRTRALVTSVSSSRLHMMTASCWSRLRPRLSSSRKTRSSWATLPRLSRGTTSLSLMKMWTLSRYSAELTPL